MAPPATADGQTSRIWCAAWRSGWSWRGWGEIGRAACRGRGEISGGAGSLKKKKKKAGGVVIVITNKQRTEWSSDLLMIERERYRVVLDGGAARVRERSITVGCE